MISVFTWQKYVVNQFTDHRKGDKQILKNYRTV